MLQPRVGAYAVYEVPEEGWEDWEAQLQQITDVLHQQGLDVITAPEAVKDLPSMERVTAFFADKQLDVLHALIICWSFDHYTIEIQQRIGLPVIISAIPGIRTGSIVGAQQLGCVLTDLEVPHKLLYGTLDDITRAQKAATYARACAIRNKLRGARIAVVGRRTEGMTPTAVDEVEILRLFGTRLINFGLDEIQNRTTGISAEETAAIWKKMSTGATAVMSTTEHGLDTARNYLVFQQLVKEQGLDAISIGSYPQCQGTMCLPIAWLNEEGVPTGCEGDVNSTLNMLLLSQLCDAPVHFGEMLGVDEETNTLVTSHCGCGSPSLAGEDGFILHPVRLANDGVCIRYTAKPGPVTFVNLVGRKNNYRMCAFEGDAIPTEMVFEGNPLKFVMKTPFRVIWDQVDEHGFGHHWMTVYGHVVPVLEAYCKLAGIKGVFPDLL
jgi:L-fucose isomerase-like protein